jgi:ATP-binding cassette subfamily F protein 3
MRGNSRMLQLKSLSKQYGSKLLFENADANLGEKSRIALVGPNGAGKSTLIRLILGQENYDQGNISMSPHIKIGYLAQELPKFENRSVIEEVMRLDGRREEILAQKKDLEEKMQHLSGGKEDDAILQAYSRVLEEVDALDEYRLPSRAEQILEGVGFRAADFHRNLSELSGGWLMRVALGRVLLLQPDLLILDEPTNHLDLESLLWLEEFLKNYPGAILMVSHDRLFLNKLVNEVWEIDQKKINCYNGNLDSFVVQKEERLTLLQSQFEGQQQKVAELQSFIDRFGAKATKARQAQSRQKQLDKMELIELPEDRSNMQFRFPPCPPSGKEVVTMKKTSVQFPGKTIFKNFDWILQRGSRVAIVGINGAGKTTLLKTLAQGLETEVSLSEGSLKLGHNVKVGYYSQLQAETLNLEWTILQELESIAPQMEIAQVRAIAGAFLFTGDDVLKKIKVLSGGEKARVALAKLLLTPNNFLLLDEPTNHLDADSREVLLQALMNYGGTLVLVSHDRDFVAPLADQLLEIQDQKVTPLILNYEEYLAKKVQETKDRMKRSHRLDLGAATHQLSEAKVKTSEVVPQTSSASKISNNQRRAWENELKKVEKEITELEKRQYELSQQLSSEDFSNRATVLRDLIDEQTKNQQSLDQKLTRWEELSVLV